jgi:D-alanyl-D-alanine carboxypeptidase/D-alanyl-D-alanine-endopeptidase (penicillin-binding protein 4)
VKTARVIFTLAVAASILSPASAASIDSRVRRILAKSPVMKQGFAGVLVVDDKGRRLVSLNPDHLFVPASNTKLFSTALALERLGPAKTFETRVELRGRDLVIVGGGDANLSGRIIPYQYNSTPNPPLTAINDLADQVVNSGIRQIDGDVVGDDTLFPYQPFASGWSIEEVLSDDGAPVSALVVNDNSQNLKVTPGPIPGSPAGVALDPPLPVFQIAASVITGSGKVAHIETGRIPGSDLWRVWGEIGQSAPPYSELWAVDDPARFAALALKFALEQRGVQVAGGVRALHRLDGLAFTAPTPGQVVAHRQSPPLIEALRIIAKVSQNLHADLLLFDIGGSRKAGLQELDHYIADLGIKETAYCFHDGSGLSRRNIVSPGAVVKLLQHMAAGQYSEQYLSLLPISGVDGSLATRLTKPATRGRIHAKTGSLDHVSALSGYADTKRGKRLIFSIFINNAWANTSDVRDLIDQLCEALVK